jgi:hypothetical protein
MNRLMMTPGLRRLWRDDCEVQFGVDPARAVVIHVADPAHAKLFDLLDGTRSERAVLRDAVGLGISARDAFAILSAVRDAGLVMAANTILPDNLGGPARARLAAEAAALAVSRRRIPAQDADEDTSPRLPTSAEALRRRASAAVLVTGITRLVVPIAAGLAAAGVGRVDPQVTGRVSVSDVTVGGLGPADVGAPRGTACVSAISRVAPDTDTRRLRDGAATFVVQAGARAPAEVLAHGLARRRLPHLLIEERDDTILIGPLVVPTRTPCLNCLDLHRRDRDRSWPAIAAQIATAPEGPGATAASTMLIAVGVATAQILGHIDGIDVEVLGGSIEITPPLTIRRRSWSPHPACRCVTRTRSPGRPPPAGDIGRRAAGPAQV